MERSPIHLAPTERTPTRPALKVGDGHGNMMPTKIRTESTLGWRASDQATDG